jgi:hypothetical protein
MAEAKTVEVDVKELMTPKNKVFFPGKAVLSEKEAESFEVYKAQADAAAADTPDDEEATAPKKSKKG